MKKIMGVFSIFLFGCGGAQVLHVSTPAEPLSMQTSSMASGVLQPQDLYFTLISQYNQDKQQARVIILTEPALKLADLTVSKEQIQVHEQAPKVPNKLISAWGQLAQEQFLTPCPARKIIHKTTALQGTFELEVTGGICQ